MRPKRIQNRFKQALPTIQAASACAEVVVEATRRGLCRESDQDVEVAEARASGQLFVLLGQHLERQVQRMRLADDRYQSLRSRQQRRRLRRDEIAGRAHAALARTRAYLQGFYGYEGTCELLGLRGPTEREPRALHRQLGEVVWWARNWEDGNTEPLVAGGDEEAEKCVANLEKLYDELDQAIGALDRGHREVETAMLYQRAAMAEFDHAYKHGAGTIEARLIQVGLPTLAAAVRPGVGRRGRPLKKRPVDLHPDLVEQVRVRGLITLEDPVSGSALNEQAGHAVSLRRAGADSGRDVTPWNAVLDEASGDMLLPHAARKVSARDRKIEQAHHEHAADEEKIEQPLHERTGAEEKGAHVVHERSESGEKSDHQLHKRSASETKTEQPLHELTDGEVSAAFSRLRLPPPVSACNMDPRGDDLGQGYRIGRRLRGPAAEEPSPKRKEGTPPWWRRVLRVGGLAAQRPFHRPVDPDRRDGE